MTYKVLTIKRDDDTNSEAAEFMGIIEVRLQDETGGCIRLYQDAELLRKEGIEEGSEVILDEENHLKIAGFTEEEELQSEEEVQTEKKEKFAALSNLYLADIVLSIVVPLALIILGSLSNADIFMKILLFQSELCMLGLTIWYMRNRGDLFLAVGYHRVKGTTLILVFLLSFSIAPIITFLNSLSLLFTDNIVLSGMASDLQNGMSSSMLTYSVALAPAICEELLYRGVFFQEYRKLLSPWKAIALSAFLFGMMHMNLNQFGYAFAFGLITALVNEASGSIMTSMFLHFIMNFKSVLLVLLLKFAAGEAGMDLSTMISTEEPIVDPRSLVSYFIFAVIGAVVSYYIIRAIARNEGNAASYSRLFQKRDKDSVIEKNQGSGWLTTSMIIAFMIALVVMVIALKR